MRQYNMLIDIIKNKQLFEFLDVFDTAKLIIMPATEICLLQPLTSYLYSWITWVLTHHSLSVWLELTSTISRFKKWIKEIVI